MLRALPFALLILPVLSLPARAQNLSQRTQVRFTAPSGMKIQWYVRSPEGKDTYSQPPLEAPARYNFRQAAVYRLKLSHIDGEPGLEVYPTLEVVPARKETEQFLQHTAVRVEFTPEDFKQVTSGNFITKVIYLPRPGNADTAPAPEQIVSSRLEPGTDPIQEALRRGSILLVIRLGNVDPEGQK